MTGVIGASSIFGCGTIMSDVRITFSDGSEHDMLQKAGGALVHARNGVWGPLIFQDLFKKEQ
jgi:hypothetical protein